MKSIFQKPDDQSLIHYYSIDFFRFFSALSVLIWHYQHFFLGPEAINDFTGRFVQPFYSGLRIFYEDGWWAVRFFWVISGFILSSAYSDRSISAKEFFGSRFARLYPLHFITLIIVACLQTISYFLRGKFQIYPVNDFYHFVLNLFFISGWGFERGFSFNFVIWSVSVEIVIYFIFFLTSRILFKKGIIGPVIMTTVFAGIILLDQHLFFEECGLFFFVGVTANIISKNLSKISFSIGMLFIIIFLSLPIKQMSGLEEKICISLFFFGINSGLLPYG